jgi:hypothetical protein
MSTIRSLSLHLDLKRVEPNSYGFSYWAINCYFLQNGTKESVAKLVSELNDAKLEDDVGGSLTSRLCSANYFFLCASFVIRVEFSYVGKLGDGMIQLDIATR